MLFRSDMPAANAKLLTENKKISAFTEEVISELKTWLASLENLEGSEEEVWQKNRKKISKLVAGWITSELFKLINEQGAEWDDLKITSADFAKFLTLIYHNKINSSSAQKILAEMFKTGGDPEQIMQDKNLGQLEDESELETIINQIIAANPEQVKEYQAGNEAILQYLIGLVMKETKGKANPASAGKMLKNKLKS